MTAIEQARDRHGRTIADRFQFDGTSLWFLIRDALFERDAGILDMVARAIGTPHFAEESFDTCHAPKPIEASEPSFGSFNRRFAQAKSAIQVFGRTALTANRQLAPSRILVVTPHGGASRGDLELPLDRWTSPYRTLLHGPGVTWISLFPPSQSVSWTRNLLSDWQSISDGRYVPWQAGLTAHNLLFLAYMRARFRRQLTLLWSDAVWRNSWSDAMPPRIRTTTIENLKDVFHALDRDLGLAWLLLVAAAAIIRRTRPSLIITFDTLGNAGRAFAHAAQRPKIRTVGVQTGIISTTGIANIGYRLARSDARAPRPDDLLLWGPRYEATLASFGWPTTSLHSTGFPDDQSSQPSFVPQSSDHSSSRLVVRTILVLANANMGICAAIVRPEDELRLMAGIIRAVSQQSFRMPLRLLIRCHPTTVNSPYGRAIAHLCSTDGNVDFDDAGVPLIQRIHESDIIFGSSSTGLIEAARAGKPVVVLAPSGIDITGFQQYGVPVIEESDDIAARIDDILNDHAKLALARERLVAHAAPDLDLFNLNQMIDTWMQIEKEGQVDIAIGQP